MKNLRSIFICLSIMILAFFMVQGSSFAKEKKYVMKLGLGNPAKDYTHTYTPWEVFKDEVERRSNGRIEVKLYPGKVLGGHKSRWEQTVKGVIQGVDVSDGNFAPFYPEIAVLSIPYLFSNHDVAYEVLDGPFGEFLKEDCLKKTGLRTIGWMENGGFRNYSNNKHEVKSPADMKGLKIRTMPIPAHMEIVKRLGAAPTPIAWSELYTALQTGVVDGQENSVSTFCVPKLEEVQKFMILDGHVYSMWTLFLNDKWYQALPRDLQAAIDQAALVTKYANRGLCRVNESRNIKYIESKGMKVYAPTAAEKKAFRDLTQGPVTEYLRTQIDPALIDRVLSAVADAEKKLGY